MCETGAHDYNFALEALISTSVLLAEGNFKPDSGST